MDRNTMTPDNARRLIALTSQLAETFMNAAICVQEIRAVVSAELDDDAVPSSGNTGPELAPIVSRQKQRPLLDDSTLSVIWKGKRLHLGNTNHFQLLKRLARRPNQYVTHLDLLRDVWEDEDMATSTIRSVARHLRRRLRGGGLRELADAIRGHGGRYILEI